MINIQTTFGEYAIHFKTGKLIYEKTLVCLHGFMGSSLSFDFLENQTDFNVLAIDLMGHGLSELSSEKNHYSLNCMAQALEEIFTSLELKNIYLFGYSFGGRVALTYAHKYPDRLKHLFLESASFGLKTNEEKEKREKGDQQLAVKLLNIGMTRFVNDWQELPLFASQKLLPENIYQKEVAQKKTQLPNSMSLALKYGSVANQLNFLETTLFETIPITYIAGSLDKKYAQIGREVKKLKQINLIIIENVGHCVHLEAPEFVAEILYTIMFEKTVEIQDIFSYEHTLELVTPFVTSYGALSKKKTDIFVIETKSGTTGYGELLSFETPDYIEETLLSDRLIIKKYLLPLLKNQKLFSPRQVRDIFQVVKGNEMAKAAIETAIWDIFAKEKGVSLGEYLKLDHKKIAVGVSIGIQRDKEELLKKVTAYVAEGYTRVKLKISPDKDISYVKQVREVFPDLTIMVDANSAYHLSDLAHLKQLDKFNLSMIEQPLGSRDFYEHYLLQKELKTPICLDENIRSLGDVKLAHHLKACQCINLKIPRVGGITEALDILAYCLSNKIDIWLGGMLESGVGRSLNLMLATHTALTHPGDLSASNRYYKKDIIQESFTLENGQMTALKNDGIGVHLLETNITKNNYWSFD